MHRRALRGALAFVATAVLLSCGGGNPPGSSSSTTTTTTGTSGSNVVAVIVDAGPNSATEPAVNTLFTTVTVCVPGSTTECQAIDNIQVDTGSYGLRILAPVLTLALPVTTFSDSSTLLECAQFVDGYSWGPVATADIQIAGESASNVPVQVIGSSSFTVVPSACSSIGPAEDTVATFGANGILGIGPFALDCGTGCTASSGFYYACTQTACSDKDGVMPPVQVTNPVTLFATDNNGTIIVLPGVAAAGAATVSGSLIFGIDTESNNASGSQTVLTLDDSGYFTTTYNGAPLNQSFIDSGSNGLYFNDTSITQCTNPDFTGFYCPTSTLSLTATLTGLNDVSATVDFSVANTETQTDANPTFTVFPELAGSYSDSTSTFDWGLPFFFGRSVYNAIQGYTTSAGTGPYVAF